MPKHPRVASLFEAFGLPRPGGGDCCHQDDIRILHLRYASASITHDVDVSSTRATRRQYSQYLDALNVSDTVSCSTPYCCG